MKCFMVILAVCLFFGCSGSNCIKVGGGYQGIDGSLEWCWDAVKAQELERPAWTGSNGEKILGITEKDASKLLEFTNETFATTSETRDAIKNQQDIFEKIVQLLKESKIGEKKQ